MGPCQPWRPWIYEEKLTGITSNDGDAHWAGDFSLVDRPQCWPTFSFGKGNPSSHRRFASNGLNCRKRRGNWALVSKLCDNFGLLQECYQNPRNELRKINKYYLFDKFSFKYDQKVIFKSYWIILNLLWHIFHTHSIISSTFLQLYFHPVNCKEVYIGYPSMFCFWPQLFSLDGSTNLFSKLWINTGNYFALWLLIVLYFVIVSFLQSFIMISHKIYTGKSLSEAFILTSTNPQYDKRFFIDLPVQYMKTTSSEHGENMLCTQIVFLFLFWHSEQFMHTTCSPHVLSL